MHGVCRAQGREIRGVVSIETAACIESLTAALSSARSPVATKSLYGVSPQSRCFASPTGLRRQNSAMASWTRVSWAGMISSFGLALCSWCNRTSCSRTAFASESTIRLASQGFSAGQSTPSFVHDVSPMISPRLPDASVTKTPTDPGVCPGIGTSTTLPSP